MKYLQFMIFSMLFISLSSYGESQAKKIDPTSKALTQLEKQFNGTIGVYAIDTNSGKTIAYRANTLFPIQSTFKLIGVAALLKQNKILLNKKIHYSKKELVAWWSPVTSQYVNQGMTLQSLAAATISYSDDSAINFIMKDLGGPRAVTAFAHQIGNKSFNVKHYEPNLNSNPQKAIDISTPKDMALSVEKIMLGNILTPFNKKMLIQWMKDNTTGYHRMRAGVPLAWSVADKTGSGSYGIANDIGMVWSPACKPIVLAIYTVRNEKSAKWRDDIVAQTTKIIFSKLCKS